MLEYNPGLFQCKRSVIKSKCLRIDRNDELASYYEPALKCAMFILDLASKKMVQIMRTLLFFITYI